MYSDFLLITKMKQGDDAAFDTFIHKYYQKMVDYLKKALIYGHTSRISS